MSFLLDPPSLVLIGIILWLVGKRFELGKSRLIVIGGLVVAIFIGISTALYLDLMRWRIPGLWDMEGSVWMFHSNITGISKADVPLVAVVVVFLLYPLWLYLGYAAGRLLTERATRARPKI
ncbi:MAG: hypothetical protein ACE5PM_03275 [Candidatus Hydrothermarchaeales archaeon]